MSAHPPRDGSPVRIDGQWREAFVLELRLLDVPGRRISEALVEVETHCEDTGEAVEEAFGQPGAYARELTAAIPEAERPALSRFRMAALGGAVMVGVLSLLSGLDAVVSHRSANISWGAVVAVAAIGVALLFAGRALRSVVHLQGRITVGVAVALLLALPILTQVLLPGRALSAPAWPTVLLGVVLLGVSGWLLRSNAARDADLLVDPRTGTDLVPVPRWLGKLVMVLPVLTLLGAVLAVLLAPRG